MTTSVEIATEPLRTIIKRPFDAEYVRSQLEMGIPVVFKHQYLDNYLIAISINGDIINHNCGTTDINSITHTIVTLPPLPRYPKPEDAGLLYAYAAQGLFPYGQVFIKSEGNFSMNTLPMLDLMEEKHSFPKVELLDALLADGTRVDIAIQEEPTDDN